MPFIDERGRVFGKINLIDLLVAICVLLIVVFAVAGVITARKPPKPVIAEVTPKEMTAARDLRIKVTGDHFLPYLRVFLQRSDQAVDFVRPVKRGESQDEYTLANAAAGVFLVESPRLAEIRLPEDLPPGTYDLHFYNETEQVGVVRKAVTVHAAAAPAPPASARVTVRVLGAFTGLRPDNVGVLKAGMRLQANESGPWAEILTVGQPRTDVARVKMGNTMVLAPVAELRQVPATLRLQCEYVNDECRIAGATVQQDAHLRLPLQGGTIDFIVEHVRSELEITREVRALVRFMVRPETAPLVNIGDTSQSVPLSGAARIVEIRNRREVDSQNVMALSDLHFQTFSAQDRVVIIDAMVSVPVVYSGYGWSYRSEPVRAGASLNFETPTYLMRGWILSVSLSNRAGTEPKAERAPGKP